MSKWSSILNDKVSSDFGFLLLNLQDRNNVVNSEEIIALLWAIWFARNQFVHNGRRVIAKESFDRAYRLLDNSFHQSHSATSINPNSAQP